MVISRALNLIPGVVLASTMMCTDSNKAMLKDVGLDVEKLDNCNSNDLIVIVKAQEEKNAQKALNMAEKLLGVATKKSSKVDESFDDALDKLPDANMTLISLPGKVAGKVAKEALEKGLHVHLFSDNVSISEEVLLKKMAKKMGLLMMGPDCGTSIINGVPLGFANSVKSGPIGVVSAAGTGLQEVSCIIDRLNSGISQGIGIGGRDLLSEVGGIMMLEAIQALEKDLKTEVIVLIGKPPDNDVFDKILDMAHKCKKPIVINLIGSDDYVDPNKKISSNVHFAKNLEEASKLAINLSSKKTIELLADNEKHLEKIAKIESSKFVKGQQFVRGLFAGGTLCSEALIILSKEVGGRWYSNTRLSGIHAMKDIHTSEGNVCIDFGADEFTKGMVHPMIDPSLIKIRLLKECHDPSVGLILLDFVLGFGANRDPVGAMIPVIREAKSIAKDCGRYLSVVASIVGTDRDLQNRKFSVLRLREVEVIVAESNAQAAVIAAKIIKGGGYVGN